jgi:hypothetical protein
MEYENNDVKALCKNSNIDPINYKEIKESETITKIKKKWPLLDQILLINNQPFIQRTK